MEWVFFTDFLQHIDFQFGSISVFLLVLYDLQGNLTSSSVGLNIVLKKTHTFHTGSTFKTCLPAVVQTLHHFPEGPLTQSVDYFICRKIVKIKYKLNRVFLKSIFQKVLKPTSVLQDISASVDQVTVFSVPLIPAQRLTAAALWTKNHQRRDKTSCNLTFLFICTSKNRTRTQRCT